LQFGCAGELTPAKNRRKRAGAIGVLQIVDLSYKPHLGRSSRGGTLPALPQQWPALCLLIFVLGLRHGLDADHLAAIDGLTRCNLLRRARMARYCGAFFAVGHGGVVLFIALLVGTLAQHWQVPEWLGPLGAVISIVFLVLLGLINVRAALSAPSHVIARTVGVKGALLGGLAQAGSPALIAFVGALFALSFDTISQTALFSLAAAHIGGWQRVLALGALFALGMLITDGVNGLWVARLIGRADGLARVAARATGLVVGSLSLVVAAITLARLTIPAVDAWSEGKELLFGATVIGVVAASLGVSMRLSRNPQPDSSLGQSARSPSAN
jgi:high-affinity nickel-transport protein